MTQMATTPPDDKIRRILSLDGGGIYGLAEALWLKELCSICPTFLDGEDVDLFAGCSSGAINALLLAMYEEPREAVLKGVLESFWTDAGTFRNSDPIGSITSLFGLSPWFSEQDFLRQLERHFGSTTFAQLKHNVLISAYSWTGGAVSFSSRTSEVAWPFSIFTPEVMRNGLPGGESWGPKYFQNYRDSSCMDYRVVDVAYGAATPPGFRKIRAGIGDGASFTANPAVAAIADARYLDLHEATTKERPPAPPSTLPEGSLLRPNPFAGFRNLFDTSKQALDAVKDRRHVESTAVLSIGSGQYMPAYWSRDIDLGFLTFPIMPTNPAWGVWYSPVAYALDPATKGDEYVCWTLLGRRFHRLNPAVLSLPTVVAAFAARFPLLKEWLVSQIHAAVRTPASLRAIEDAATFIQFDWQWSHLPEDIARSRGPHPDERLQEGYSRLEENLKPSAFAEQFAYQALLALAQALRQQDAGRAPTDQERDERLLEWLGKFRAEYKGTQAAEITTVLAEAEANHRLGRYAQAANGYQTFLEAAAKVSQDLWRITPEQWGFIREAKGEVEGKDGFQGELLERAKRGRVTYHEVCAERLRGREREEAELLRGLVASQVKALREWWPSSMTAPPAGGAEPPAR